MDWAGNGVYARGNYDEAVKALLQAADPHPNPIRVLATLSFSTPYDRSPNQVDEVIERFRKFAELQPRNAQAQYDNMERDEFVEREAGAGPRMDLGQVESLLKKSVARNPALPSRICSWAISTPTRTSTQRRSRQSICLR